MLKLKRYRCGDPRRRYSGCDNPIVKSRPDITAEIAAAVLAGGEGSRMGRAKADVPLGGRPMISYPLEALQSAGFEPFVVTKADRPLDLDGIEVILEPDRPRHPLVGIAAAIERAAGRPLLVVACDLPLLTPALLAWLAVQPGDSVLPRVGGHPQPLAARYGPEAGNTVRDGLARGLPVRTVIEALAPTVIEEEDLARFGSPERLFFNVNTPADLRRAEAFLQD